MDSRFANLRPQPGVALQHQITRYLRDLILRGEIAPEERLPTIRELADLWDTNSFTVQAAISPLVAEGLIIRRPRLGTFVKARSSSLTTVGVYHNHLPVSTREDAFATATHTAICRLLAGRGIHTIPWFDHRPRSEQNQPLPAMQEAIRNGLIQGLLVTSASGLSLPWLQRLGVPLAMITSNRQPATIGLDNELMARMAVDTLIEQGCRRVGVLSHIVLNPSPASDSDVRGHFLHYAEQCGLETDPLWSVAPESPPASMEACGYELFHALWSLPERPDGLFIFPDVVARGAIHAILERQVNVGKELHLVVHRNDLLDIFSPVPVTWLEARVEDFAVALVTQLERLLSSRPAPRLLLPVHRVT